MNIKILNEGFMRKYMKAVNEDFNPLEGLRSNIIEFPNGEVVYIGYENGKLFAGSATNTGIIHEFEIDYDRDASVDENIGELYDTIVENNPSYFDEPENESVKAGPSHKVNEAKNPSKDDLEPRQRTAVDGVTYWVVYDKANKKYSTLTCFGKYKTKKKAQDAIDSCKLLESKKLTEGASNFWSMEDLPLLVFDDYDTVYDRVYDMTKEQLGDDAEDIDDTPEFEKNWDDYYDYCVLDEDGQKSLQDDIDSFNKTCKYADDFDEYEYALVEVKIKSGYYEAAQLYCDTTNIGDTQLEKVKQFFDEMKKKYGLTQLGVSYRASNGETGYHKVNEASETGHIVTVCPECGYKNRARVTFPAFNKPFADTEIDCVNCGTKLKVHDEHKYNDDGTIEESNLPKVQKQLARADSGDKDIARDLALIIENDGDIYRRGITPVITNLKRKKAKGNFDKELAVQAYVNIVSNALRDTRFARLYSYDIKNVNVPTRYLTAKVLADYYDEDLDESLKVNESLEDVKKFLQPLVTDKGRVRALRNDEKLPRGVKFKSNNGTSGEISFKGTDYAYAVVDGKLKVMTSADAGSNWSETLYKNESCKNVNEAKRGFIRKYKGCSLHDAGDKIVVTDEHGKNIGEERTESAAEGVIDSYIAKKTKATESLHEDVDVSDEDRIKALAEYLDVSADEISKTYGHEFETPDGDYLVCDENEARELAEEDINNSIDEMGIEAFSEDFQEWIKDNALDTGWFDSAMRESYESYVEDIESEGDSTYDNRLIQEMYDADILTDDDFVADGDDIDYTQLKEDVDIDSKKSDFVDYLCGQQGDPVEWYRDNFGEKELTDTIKSYDYILDRDAIVDECITWDGVSHFIATYDGDEIELGNNLYAYRTN